MLRKRADGNRVGEGRTSRGWRRKTAVAVLALMAAAGLARGEDQTEAAPKVNFAAALVEETKCALLDGDEKKTCLWLEKQRLAEDKLKAEVAIGFNGDETSDEADDQFKLDADINLAQGLYPTAIRIKSGARLRFDEGDLEDEVTTLLFNYDYYFLPWLESFAFTERFSDSFMDIEERYEIGFGVDFEHHFFGQSVSEADDACRGVDFDAKPLRKPIGLTADAHEHLQRTVKAVERLDVDSKVRKGFCNRLPGILKDNSRLTTGLGFSSFAEFEKPEPFEIVRAERPVTSEFSVGPEWRFRWAVRPSVRWRITDELEVLARVYFKLPLTGEWKVDGDLDYRTEGQFLMTVALDQRGKLALTGEVDYRHDSAPPRISAAQLMMLEEDGFDLSRSQVVAEDEHWIYSMKLKLTL